MKKYGILFLCILVAVGMLTACGSKEAQDFKFKKNEDKKSYTLIAYTGTDENVTIPEEYKGLPVTRINSAFEDCETLKRVVIPESVKVIGDDAFRNCGNLETVAIPESVRKIGGYAFSCCTSLTELVIPQAVELDWFAFNGCTGLRSLSLGSESSNGDCEIGRGAFTGCEGITKVVIGAGYSEIEGHAFSGCANLTTVYLPGGLEEISAMAFEMCPKLTDIYFAGTSAAWQQMDRDSLWIEHEADLVIHFTNGDQ